MVLPGSVTGQKLNLGAGHHRLDGFTNLDLPWKFQDGLPGLPDSHIAAITISHSLMYVPENEWPACFTEFHRLLKPAGMIRITEDYTTHPGSERYGGHPDAVTLTSPALVKRHLRDAGFHEVTDRTAATTGWHDWTLVQAWHGAYPKVFHVEATR